VGDGWLEFAGATGGTNHLAPNSSARKGTKTKKIKGAEAEDKEADLDQATGTQLEKRGRDRGENGRITGSSFTGIRTPEGGARRIFLNATRVTTQMTLSVQQVKFPRRRCRSWNLRALRRFQGRV